MVAVPQLTWEVHSRAEFRNDFHFTNSVWGGGWPTRTAGNIVSCGMRDDVPSGYEVLNSTSTLSWRVKKSSNRVEEMIE